MYSSKYGEPHGFVGQRRGTPSPLPTGAGVGAVFKLAARSRGVFAHRGGLQGCARSPEVQGKWRESSGAGKPTEMPLAGWGEDPREPATGCQEVDRACLRIEPIKAL